MKRIIAVMMIMQTLTGLALAKNDNVDQALKDLESSQQVLICFEQGTDAKQGFFKGSLPDDTKEIEVKSTEKETCSIFYTANTCYASEEESSALGMYDGYFGDESVKKIVLETVESKTCAVFYSWKQAFRIRSSN